MSLSDRLFILSQHLTPQHALSRAIGKLADSRTPFIKNTFIKWFIKRYNVNMQEALLPSAEDYACFNDFFTRALKDGARPIHPDASRLVMPVDGAVSQAGSIDYGKIFQAKGHSFSLVELLGGDLQRAQPFIGGEFATIYLSPKDYHRIHMPIDGELREMIYVPGKLYSVNPLTTENVPALFARNERVVCIFDTPLGPMSMTLVGAMIVASVETVWAGRVAPMGKTVRSYTYKPGEVTIKRGEEMGRFCLGSTVVMTFPKGSMRWREGFKAETPVRLGEDLGEILQTVTAVDEQITD
ncbi:archaetidylserine decarboxylase [Hahella sp. CR1]|uniref:archaetidylserine decarboxylase n=1 Tax=Hahella sp. CR1 TaxID=2992807 RepID=UPI00244252E3|nr:archaetidylserine decarboxylase [Hahella sp. CR1]MDG9671131.1 archaetidylserine decarboxylase [Hahella sp. CR1]